MKKIVLFVTIFSLSLALKIYANPFGEVPNVAFKRGEKLTYVVYYKTFLGKIKAGEITLEVKNDNRKFNGRSTYHIEAIGKSKHSLKWLMKVDDKFESFIDEKAMIPWLFTSKKQEGDYRKDDKVEFSPHKNIAVSKRATKKTPPQVQDIISAFYFARTTDFSKLQPGEHFSIPIFMDDSVYHSAIIFNERDVTKTPLGKFNCVKFKPMVMTGEVFKNRYPMTVWISDDENKIPVHIESSLFIGKVEVELIATRDLANPLTSKID